MKTMNISIVSAAIIAVFGSFNTNAQCADPDDPNCVSTNGPPGTNTWTPSVITNQIGYPVIRITSLRTSNTTNDIGNLVATNYGFTITTNNMVESVYEKFSDIDKPYKWWTLGVINTDTNRKYVIMVTTRNAGNPYSPIELSWNGIGTNEYTFTSPLAVSSSNNFFFKVKDVGAAE